jgi:ABC-type bacteriocin/lantibiotic exporter with double-glycine peptidase domain
MKRLKVTHYLQDPCCCAVASCATAANYYNSEINYENTKILAKKISKKVADEGIESSQICMLLNKLGFHKVTYITSYLNLVDYDWQKFGRKRMIKIMEQSVTAKKDKDEKAMTRLALKWLKDFEYDNQLIISYDFGKYIRQHLNKKMPVILGFNWTMFQKFAKDGENGPDPFNGEEQEHAVVVNGYDDKGVWIVDSHHKFYKYKRKKYRRGFYKISWENLMTCMGQGDVYLPSDYSIE